MDERTKKIVTGIIAALIFIVCVALIVVGQKHVGLHGLFIMLVGLAGLVGLLAFYNSKFR